MPKQRIRDGMCAGLIAGAATAGAVAAFAWRTGDPLRALTAIGRSLLPAGLPAAAFTVGGLLLHLAAAVAWGSIFGLVAWRQRGRYSVFISAAAVAVAAALVHLAVLPMLRLGYGLSVFPLGGTPLVFLYVVYAAALAAGMRLAQREW